MSGDAETDPTWIRYEPLGLVAASMALGIFVDRLMPVSTFIWWSLIPTCLLAWWLCGSARESIGSTFVLLAVASAGGAWHHACWHWVPGDAVVAHIREEPQPIAVEATITESPRIIPAPPSSPLRAIPVGDLSRCEVEVVRVREGLEWRAASGKARLTLEGHLLGMHVGDVIRVFATYERPTPALNPGEFDFADFERSEGRYVSLAGELPECATLISKGSAWNARRWIDDLRLAGDLLLRKHLSPARAPLAAAVMLGEREYLDADRNERFLVTGTVHLLAISGLNLGILVYLFWMLGRSGMLSRRGTLMAAIAFAVIYALLTDAQPPVTRAAVLIVVFCVARWSGRPISPWNVLAAAAIIVMIVNPASVFHVGAQLSFLAVATLAWFQPELAIRSPADPLDRLIANTRPWFVRANKFVLAHCWQVVLTGAVVWLISLPLVWYRYNLVSPIAVPLNPLVALPMAIALFAGFAVLVLSWLFPWLGAMAGWTCDRSLWLLEATIAWAEPMHAGYYWLPAPPSWHVAVFYVLLALAAVFPVCRLRRLWQVALLAVWIVVGCYLAMPIQWGERRELAATFVSVGHGAAVLVELPDGRNLLYDCGRLGSPLSGARPISAVLWSRGITHLDAVMISHADSDHYNALPELFDRFSVGAVYVSTMMWFELPPGIKALKESIEERSIPIVELKTGERLKSKAEGVLLEVLHPPRGGVLGSDNAQSIVLLVEYQGRRLLLTGDLEERGLRDLLSEPAIDIDVLMVPHHGSTRSNPQGLAEWCRPEYVVISGTSDFELGRDPNIIANAFRAAGCEVFHTAQNGAVRFEFSQDGVVARPMRRGE